VQLAGFFVGGDASDVKVRPEIRFFAPLTRKLVLAGRMTAGFLFTEDYGGVLDESPRTDLIEIPPGEEEGGDVAERRRLIREIQILERRGLYSGGPVSNRGYGFNEISPHRVLGDDGRRLSDPDAIGGRTLWELSIELRFPISGALGGTAFVDSSDVTAGIGELRIDHPHVSTGIGLRYETPVGPLRFDIGYRIHGLQVIGEVSPESCVKSIPPDEPTRSQVGPVRGSRVFRYPASSACPELIIDEGDGTSLFGAPVAVSIAIGNAF
jgi:outer membrane protein insertion porin family/translocation and assembly module TamA